MLADRRETVPVLVAAWAGLTMALGRRSVAEARRLLVLEDFRKEKLFVLWLTELVLPDGRTHLFFSALAGWKFMDINKTSFFL